MDINDQLHDIIKIPQLILTWVKYYGHEKLVLFH